MSISLAEKYIKSVLSGEKLVCEYVRLAVKRHQNDLITAPERGLYFDKKAAEKVFAFFSLVNHCPDKTKWVSFQCQDWQAFIVYVAFGWKKANGSRRFNYVYTEIAKKNGKTTFAAIVATYLLFFDGENEAEVYCAATVEKQARLCFDMTKRIIQKSPALAPPRSTILTKNISILSTASKMEPLGRDSDSIEGANPSGAIIDEYHVWKNNEVFDNLRSGAVNRRQPFFFIITTAGFDKTLPCFGYRSFCLDVLKGIKQQDDLFPIIFTIDEGDDWKDPANWFKANPNYLVSVRQDALSREFASALNDPRQEVNFKTKHLNLWVDAPEVWIKDEKILGCNYGTTDEDLIGQQCYAGLDLASHVDINALALLFPNVNGRAVAKFFFWIPEAKVVEKQDRVDYRTWQRDGFINVTSGDVIDIDQMTSQLSTILQNYECLGLAYDPAKAYHGVIQNLQKEGLEEILHEFSQGIRTMSEPTRMLEKLVTSNEIDLMHNPVIRWMFSNVQTWTDGNDNIKADKGRSREKIDGVVALINAVGEWQTRIYTNEATMSATIEFVKF
jgi:phage terminase large subunit-like protein